MLELEIRRKIHRTAGGTPLLAVENLSLHVGQNEFICLTGPSGCGKTTSLNILLGLDTDFEGKVHRPEGARVAAIFQEPRLLPWRTVEQNVRLGLPHGERAKNLDGLFAALGLEQLRGFYPRELSLGLARRAAMARAFALSPDILIMDEPFVSLDEETANDLRQLLKTMLTQHPASVLMVTHNLEEAYMLADRIVYLTARPATVLEVVAGTGMQTTERTPLVREMASPRLS